jgi:hypothetical protein
MPNDAPVTQPAQCPKCGAALTIQMDRFHPDARLRQRYACPACASQLEGIFGGRVIRVVRRWDGA